MFICSILLNVDYSLVLPYLLALLIGVSLGLIGGGGSILTVPILVYAASVDPVLATAYSLFVVGASALAGAIAYLRKKRVSYKAAIAFGVPSIIAVYLTRAVILPAIPETLFRMGNQVITKGVGILIFFSIIMAAAAVSMIRNGNKKEPPESPLKFNYLFMAAEGIVVGTLTGIVGAGGGFLIIPALVIVARLPMKLAVGTSLLIIAAKSLIGFTGDITSGQPIDWPFLLLFTLFAVVGIFAGSVLSNKVDGGQLKKGFGWFVLIMAIYILGGELFF